MVNTPTSMLNPNSRATLFTGVLLLPQTRLQFSLEGLLCLKVPKSLEELLKKRT